MITDGRGDEALGEEGKRIGGSCNLEARPSLPRPWLRGAQRHSRKMPDSQNLRASNKLVQVVCLLAFLPFVDVGSILVIKA